MSKHVLIAIADPSVIIREGMAHVLRSFSRLNLEVLEFADIEHLEYQLQVNRPDILIINPVFLGVFSLQVILNASGCNNIRCVALNYLFAELPAIKGYDASVSIYDSSEAIKEKIHDLIEKSDKEKIKHDSLSGREKEIIVCVVKGMTNKQIADHLCLSTHTVITHRRNIASKLQIHSPAGLTIYAIVNKLVELDDIKDGVSNMGEL
ncbi:MAG: LuxR C-terminal-related transcriptional regulator [Rikenellaceae bacterium]|nr:LuxR C-terminal-related transcriptional regulator [Rikenellaceae bacterium]